MKLPQSSTSDIGNYFKALVLYSHDGRSPGGQALSISETSQTNTRGEPMSKKIFRLKEEHTTPHARPVQHNESSTSPSDRLKLKRVLRIGDKLSSADWEPT